MEEILASIRRIISDDESSSARQPPASAKKQDDEGLEIAEGDADDKIIDDIARVLSGSQPPVEDEEDILDLTAELGGAEIVEEVTVVEVVAPIEMPSSEIAQPESAAESEAPEAQAEAAPPSAQPALSASEEAASALERAIAALRAGQLPTSVSEFMPKSESKPEPEPAPAPQSWTPMPETAFAPAPEPEPAPEAETAPEAAPEAETALDFEPEPQSALTDFDAEMSVEETVAVAPPVESNAEESSFEPIEPAPWARAPEPPIEPERSAVRGNGGENGASQLDTSHKSLEDSVKDMLRPMLRQWLDENMPRMVTSALKDELGERRARGQGD
jgi:cell pole-organizing protein PopZ